jgi:HD-like signal output (HDOD) protein
MALSNPLAVQPLPRFGPTSTELEIEDIEDIVRSALDSKRFRPPLLPDVAMRLSRLVEDPNADLAQAEAAVVSDPNVAARVVAVANSAAIRGRMEVTSLRLAIARLGLVGVRDVAFQVVAAGKVFRVPAYSERMEALFEAAQASGTLSKSVAVACGIPSQAAFLCGLLHDMGEAIVLGIVADACKSRRARLPDIEALSPIMDATHAQFGAVICSEWKLPDVTVDAAAHHHQPELSTQEGSLAAAVAVADLLLRHIGLGRPWQPVTKADMPILEAARLPTERIGPLLRQAEEFAVKAKQASSQ